MRWWFGLKNISIHALREEGDLSGQSGASVSIVFLSTPSVRRATLAVVFICVTLLISIHALREEGDMLLTFPNFTCEISIHALREEGDLFDL